MIHLASTELCTGCGACAYKCPKHCITMQENSRGLIFPMLDDSDCISCHLCERVCPILNPLKLNEPLKAYAAWTSDERERMTSASGGVANSIYKYALAHDYKVVGASHNSDFSVTLKVAYNESEIIPFKNSKYVFSDGYNVFSEIHTLLNNGEKIVIIGLPCQIAAFRKIFKENDNLFLIDIICHGTTPLSYLKQHVSSIEKKCGKKTSKIFFRDPKYQTSKYYFSLYDENDNCFYSRRTKDGDLYQFGYHKAIIYRENCYHCKYACKERNGDLTIADYHGLGKKTYCEYSAENVSLILVNSRKGFSFLQNVIEKNGLFVDERPLSEPIDGEKQLRNPSHKTKYRNFFEDEICKSNGMFEYSMRCVYERFHKDKVMQASFYIKLLKYIKSFYKKKYFTL